MNVHIIESGIVENTIAIESVSAAQALFPDAICIAATTGSVGDLWDGTSLIKPPINLPAAAATLIKSIDIDVDAIYAAAIGNRGPEYDQAESDALAYKAAGYTGTVPASVASWATAKGWTAQASADDIIVAAARLTTARDAIRAQRLLRKEQARVATTEAGLATITAQWSGFVSVIRSQLGV